MISADYLDALFDLQAIVDEGIDPWASGARTALELVAERPRLTDPRLLLVVIERSRDGAFSPRPGFELGDRDP